MAPENDNPFLARPDEHKVGAANELYCWMPSNSDRECNGSCVAYDPGMMELTGGPCLVLANFCRAASFLCRPKSQLAQKAKELTEIINQIPSPPEVK